MPHGLGIKIDSEYGGLIIAYFNPDFGLFPVGRWMSVDPIGVNIHEEAE